MVPTRTTTDRRVSASPSVPRRLGPRSLARAAWDGNGGPPRPASLTLSSEAMSMDPFSFFLVLMALILMAGVARDDR